MQMLCTRPDCPGYNFILGIAAKMYEICAVSADTNNNIRMLGGILLRFNQHIAV